PFHTGSRRSLLKALTLTPTIEVTTVELTIATPILPRTCVPKAALSAATVGISARFVKAGTKWTLPQFWCNLAVGWRNLHESREPLCDCFAWSFAACGDFFEVAVWSFGIRSFRQHTLPSPSSVQRPTPHVL